jgi:hypothetical protein
MTPIYARIIEGPCAWTPASLGGKDGLVHEIGGRHLAAFDTLLDKTRRIRLQDLTRADFAHDDLADLIEGMRNEALRGKCAVILRGLDRARYSQEECERIFWGLGVHLGTPAVQSSRADRLGYVRHEPDDPKARGYRGSGELVLHTDSRAVIALMSLQNAARGGHSQIASSATIHNVIFRERPDLLEPLYRGYPYHSTEIELTPCSIPIFSNVDGVVSCAFFEGHMRKAAQTMGKPLPSDLDEALTYFARTAAREDVRIEFMLEPGEIMICNNFAVLHARTEFENAPGRERLLARLWLNVPDGRPTVPELLERSRRFDRNYDPLFVEAV